MVRVMYGNANTLRPWNYLIPGITDIQRGSIGRGILLLLLFILPLWIIGLNLESVFQLPRGAPVDMWIAYIYLLILTVFSYMLNTNSLRPETHRPKGESIWEIAREKVWSRSSSRIGLILLVIFYSCAIIAPLVAPHDPIKQMDVVQLRYLPPSLSTGYLLGTDGFGRDLLSRLIYGARISLSIGFIAVALSVIIGTIIGLIAGFFEGVIDSLLMRTVDLMLGFPRLILILIVIGFVGPSIFWVILILGLTGWMGVARLVRGEVLSIKENEFVDAARSLGVGTSGILIRHLLPNTLAPILVFASLTIGNVILIEAGLSFLGLGVQPPMPSWGNIINLGRNSLLDGWWISAFPGFAIVITVVSFNLVGDALRDVFDPNI